MKTLGKIVTALIVLSALALFGMHLLMQGTPFG